MEQATRPIKSIDLHIEAKHTERRKVIDYGWCKVCATGAAPIRADYKRRSQVQPIVGRLSPCLADRWECVRWKVFTEKCSENCSVKESCSDYSEDCNWIRRRKEKGGEIWISQTQASESLQDSLQNSGCSACLTVLFKTPQLIERSPSVIAGSFKLIICKLILKRHLWLGKNFSNLLYQLAPKID